MTSAEKQVTDSHQQPFVLLFFTLAVIGCRPSLDYSIEGRDARIREFVTRQLESGRAPGIQYVVTCPDSFLSDLADGIADIANNKPMQSHTTMMAYSITKTITAAAVMQLIEKGLVQPDDPASEYFSDLPYGNRVTIRHLLAQTSGIPNPIPLRWVHLAEDHAQFDESRELRAILNKHDQLDCPPGGGYKYSNISYWVLGRIIENVSRQSYQDYVHRNIFTPLGFSSTEAACSIPVTTNHAKGYLPRESMLNLFKSFVMDSKFFGEYEEGWLHLKDHYINGPAFGGLVTSARTLAVFLQDQIRDSSVIFSNETRELFFEQQRNNKEELIPMTLGWHVGSTDGIRYYFKEGGGGGFHGEMRVYPDYRIGTVVIANNTTFDTSAFLDVVDKEFVIPSAGTRDHRAKPTSHSGDLHD